MKSAQTVIKRYLKDNHELTPELLDSIVTDVLDEVSKKHNTKLQTLLQQKEKLDLEIKKETHLVQEIRQTSFTQIEAVLHQDFEVFTPEIKQQLTQLKLQSVDILDALREITESAFVSALENGENLEATIQEIARDLTLKTLKDGYLSLERAKHVVGTIISTATDIAEAAPNVSKEILRATLYGTKKGLTQAIGLFKERFAYIPTEIQPLQIQNMQQTIKDLRHTDSLFIQVINDEAKETSPMMQKELTYIVERMRPDLSELITVSVEALNIVSDTLSNVSKEALHKGQNVLQSKAAIEAKRMGVNVWAVAKSAIGGAINSAKDAIEQSKNGKK